MDEVELLKQFRRDLPGPSEERARALRAALLRNLEASPSPAASPRLTRSMLRPPRYLRPSDGRAAPLAATVRVGRRLALLTAVAVAVAGAGSMYLVTHEPTEGKQPGTLGPLSVGSALAGDRDLLALFNAEEPLLPGGTEVTLEDAAALVQHPIYRIEDGSGALPEVWLSQSKTDSDVSYEVALRYDSDLVLTFSPWPGGSDPVDTYERMASAWEAGYTTTIAGHPAWVVPPGAQGPGSPPVSVVHVTVGDVDVTLFGRMPIEALVSLAGRLTPV
jgi:hypothetical protein